MENNPPAPWKTLETKSVFNHPVLQVETSQRQRPGRDPHEFVLLKSPTWVNVIATTDDGQAVLIKQWRHGTGDFTVEIPGGLVDPGEDPIQAGVRELMEETGYSAREIISLGWVHPNPALFNNQCHTIWARGAMKTGEQQLDDAEDIQVLLSPLKDLPALVTKGRITHSLVISALSLFWLERGGID